MAAAKAAGLAPSDIAALVVQGDNRRGLGHAITKAIGDAGINLSFVMAQVVGRRYSAMFGFENEADAAKATALIKKDFRRGAKRRAIRVCPASLAGTGGAAPVRKK
jgi:hypothetical protein